MSHYIDGEIQYESDAGTIHSDVSMPIPMDSETHRKYLHDLLDEWIDKGNNTGGIYFGDCLFFPESIQDMKDILDEYKRRNK